MARRMNLRTLAFATLLVSATARADMKIAYVDLQRALLETNEGKAAKARLQSMLDARQKDLDKQQEELRHEKEQLDKQASMMSEEARNEKQMALQKKLIDLTQKVEKGRAEMDEKQRTEMQAIFGKMNTIIGQIAQREGLTLVFDKNEAGIVFAPPSWDITNELVRLYNDQNKASGGTPPAGGTKAPKKDG